jgi:hypothetical protein
MLNVGFYGHSNCAYRSEDSLIDIFSKLTKSNIVNIGVRQGSEERILFELKKTKSLDLAVIFHSEPQYLFLPDCDRDIGINNVHELRIQYLFDQWDRNFFQTYHRKFIDKFEKPEVFHQLLQDYKKFLYHPDLQNNRYYGSLIQIDQYLTSKNIPAIHVVNSSIPNWFKFTSGLIDNRVNDIIKEHAIRPGEWFVNIINKEGNQQVADRLKELAEELIPSLQVL